MTKLTDEVLVKQPAYVQVEIRNLRDQVARLEAKVEWLEDQDRALAKQSNTVVNDGITHRTALKPNSRVEFYINDPEKTHWRSYIDVRVSTDGNRVEVHGSDAMSMDFHSSNHVTLTLRD